MTPKRENVSTVPDLVQYLRIVTEKFGPLKLRHISPVCTGSCSAAADSLGSGAGAQSEPWLRCWCLARVKAGTGCPVHSEEGSYAENAGSCTGQQGFVYSSEAHHHCGSPLCYVRWWAGRLRGMKPAGACSLSLSCGTMGPGLLGAWWRDTSCQLRCCIRGCLPSGSWADAGRWRKGQRWPLQEWRDNLLLSPSVYPGRSPLQVGWTAAAEPCLVLLTWSGGSRVCLQVQLKGFWSTRGAKRSGPSLPAQNARRRRLTSHSWW